VVIAARTIRQQAMALYIPSDGRETGERRRPGDAATVIGGREEEEEVARRRRRRGLTAFLQAR